VNKIGIILINLGTPEAPTSQAVRVYLRQFLSDRRVVDLPRLLWLPVLYGFILLRRPALSAKKYKKIWTNRGSPLRWNTQDQAHALQKKLHQLGLTMVQVAYAMRYGSSDIASTITALQSQGCDRILALPLYPQYAASSTASALEAVYSALMTRNTPALRTVTSFYDAPGYINAIANKVRRHWSKSGQAEHLIISFHGIPQASVAKGDPYYEQCQQTGLLLAKTLGLDPSQYTVTFQSRFGLAAWLQPYTVDTLVTLAKSGIKTLDIICPGFIADCLETLEEIQIEGKEIFEKHGGISYQYISCLNADDEWIEALAGICQQQLLGWVT
jgi:ferrochelatase